MRTNPRREGRDMSGGVMVELKIEDIAGIKKLDKRSKRSKM